MRFEFKSFSVTKYKCCLCEKDIPKKIKRFVCTSNNIAQYCLTCAMKRIKRERELFKENEKIFIEVERAYNKYSREKKYKIIDKG